MQFKGTYPIIINSFFSIKFVFNNIYISILFIFLFSFLIIICFFNLHFSIIFITRLNFLPSIFQHLIGLLIFSFPLSIWAVIFYCTSSQSSVFWSLLCVFVFLCNRINSDLTQLHYPIHYAFPKHLCSADDMFQKDRKPSEAKKTSVFRIAFFFHSKFFFIKHWFVFHSHIVF